MVELNMDKKSDMWIITRTDSEGYHHQLAISNDEMRDLMSLWMDEVI